MWGQVLDESSPIVWLGIIPTRVGTRLNAIRNSASQKDHPNACGDKWYRDFKFPFARGSSPRVWGQATATEVSTNLSGIIPTRVGTSDRNACRVCKRWDHPHACGDKQRSDYFVGYWRDHPHACGDKPLYTITTRQIVGSSPRVWGQVKVINMRGSKRRIIPTRVGTRFFLSVCIIPQEDHPHACGDKRACRQP